MKDSWMILLVLVPIIWAIYSKRFSFTLILLGNNLHILPALIAHAHCIQHNIFQFLSNRRVKHFIMKAISHSGMGVFTKYSTPSWTVWFIRAYDIIYVLCLQVFRILNVLYIETKGWRLKPHSTIHMYTFENECDET